MTDPHDELHLAAARIRGANTWADHNLLWTPDAAELVAAALQDEALYHYDARPAVVALARHLNGGTQ